MEKRPNSRKSIFSHVPVPVSQEGGFVPLGSITISPAPSAPKADEKKEEVMGD
jgi:hypothetical protein